ncbi:peptidylprolyl isomerase [Corallococcus sp. AB049A]|uniref:Peptidyl-prolyl cis-trans isomerase n=1 Tax=Corallococcus interemptor TaxID=2316720 RepID=A0A3A8Q3M8_9BACT|nr:MULTISPECIES: peptidylprolyl isomerase [Corallococcus]RKH46656.1 peptidylprolyl isomerase [Corallococcus sp. AB050B]RKH62061.1 peptidylprolyl isomerase [Corallococcus interemptor]RKI66237.1 peptidylprolyl isomerase [Corallococcus sp. AB049A]
MSFMEQARAGVELYGTFNTTEGRIVVRLFSKESPRTVENFVGLATGEKTWTDPITFQPQHGRPLYDGTLFFRCIKDFMIQGGDPTSRGNNGPGFRFEDEFQGGRRFDKKGVLAMGNTGPNTNGSQFFITAAPQPHLDNRYTIFGEVVEGQDVVDRIANELPKDSSDRPRRDVRIQTLTISTARPS